jgi:threonine aldolase
MKRVSQWASDRKIDLHLDGARALSRFRLQRRPGARIRRIVRHCLGLDVKYFNAASGAVLAGPKSLLDNLFMFGNGLCQVWPFAAVALHYFEGFQERYAKAVATSEEVIAALQYHPRFEVTRVPNGTNIFSFRVKGVDGADAQVFQPPGPEQRPFHSPCQRNLGSRQFP